MKLVEIIKHNAVVFLDEETDILISWNGEILFHVFAGKFDGSYDNIDDFYHKVTTLAAAKTAAEMCFQEHSNFNPGP